MAGTPSAGPSAEPLEPFCPGCDARMMLAAVDAGGPRHFNRVFACGLCHHLEIRAINIEINAEVRAA
jgi:hypothetical protein